MWGGTVGDAFVLDGVSYVTTAFHDDASSDLRIWQVSGTFPAWAPLYRQTTEVGKPLIVFGRGLGRGADVVAAGTLKGWEYGSGSGALRWGENVVTAIRNGGSGFGELLYATFDATGGPNEVHLTTGDSSGAEFIQDGGEWKLAGINYAVDGPFNTTNTGGGFNAALFDAGGLYYLNGGTWVQLSDLPANIPSGFYATRISSHTVWIDSVLTSDSSSDAPLLEPVPLTILGAALAAVGVRTISRRRDVRARA
jgi:hypothetical protein